MNQNDDASSAKEPIGFFTHWRLVTTALFFGYLLALWSLPIQSGLVFLQVQPNEITCSINTKQSCEGAKVYEKQTTPAKQVAFSPNKKLIRLSDLELKLEIDQFLKKNRVLVANCVKILPPQNGRLNLRLRWAESGAFDGAFINYLKSSEVEKCISEILKNSKYTGIGVYGFKSFEYKSELILGLRDH